MPENSGSDPKNRPQIAEITKTLIDESKIVAAQEIYGITGNSCCPGKFSKRYGDMLTGGTSGELITGRCGGHSSEATEDGDELTKTYV
ncbi:hypothetical protein TYRP_013555 [Tyrophagus putrescentiae]|nr:hypothetical protein TYRP_013555 [Tyrophagus putrescentiae]